MEGSFKPQAYLFSVEINRESFFDKHGYERKDNMWKLCFRAGKETTEAGRKFAQAWLGELK
jgi:hypothetical protein